MIRSGWFQFNSRASFQHFLTDRTEFSAETTPQTTPFRKTNSYLCIEFILHSLEMLNGLYFWFSSEKGSFNRINVHSSDKFMSLISNYHQSKDGMNTNVFYSFKTDQCSIIHRSAVITGSEISERIAAFWTIGFYFCMRFAIFGPLCFC